MARRRGVAWWCRDKKWSKDFILVANDMVRAMCTATPMLCLVDDTKLEHSTDEGGPHNCSSAPSRIASNKMPNNGKTLEYTIVLMGGTRTPHVGIGINDSGTQRLLHFDEDGIHEDALLDPNDMNDHYNLRWGQAFFMDRSKYKKIRAELSMFAAYVSGARHDFDASCRLQPASLPTPQDPICHS